MAGAKQPVHWFLEVKHLGIQQGTSVWGWFTQIQLDDAFFPKEEAVIIIFKLW